MDYTTARSKGKSLSYLHSSIVAIRRVGRQYHWEEIKSPNVFGRLKSNQERLGVTEFFVCGHLLESKLTEHLARLVIYTPRLAVNYLLTLRAKEKIAMLELMDETVGIRKHSLLDAKILNLLGKDVVKSKSRA